LNLLTAATQAQVERAKRDLAYHPNVGRILPASRSASTVPSFVSGVGSQRGWHVSDMLEIGFGFVLFDESGDDRVTTVTAADREDVRRLAEHHNRGRAPVDRTHGVG